MRRYVHAHELPARRAPLWALGALLLLLYAPTLVWLVERWSMGVWYHVHGFVVFPIAGWLTWRTLKADAGGPPVPSAWGFAFLIPALLLQVVDAMLGFQILSAISLVLIMPGLSLLLLGRERTRAIWFPLLFLGFALPIPLMVARQIHMVLRHVAATGTGTILDLMGYDVLRQGTSLRVGPEAIEIADACSGFSTLTALFMVGLLLPYLAKARWWRGGLLLALVFPIAALANIVRCTILVMLVAAFGTEILQTAIHPISGVATFVLALVLLTQAEKLLFGKRPAAEARP